MHGACTKRPYFHFQSKIWRHHRVPRPRLPLRRDNFGDLAINRGLYCVFFIAHARNGRITTFGTKSDVNSRWVTTMWANRPLQTNYANSVFHPSWVDKWVAGLFIGCVLRWRHLVNTCEAKAHLIGCWQKPWRRLFLAAYTLWAKPGCCCCPAWQSVCRVIAALRGRLLHVV